MPFSDTELQLDAPPPYSATDPAASCAPAVTSSQLGRPPQYGSVNAARPYQPYGIAPQWSQSYNATLTPPVATQPLLASRQQPPAVQVQCNSLFYSFLYLFLDDTTSKECSCLFKNVDFYVRIVVHLVLSSSPCVYNTLHFYCHKCK